MDTDLPDYLKDALINSAGAETIPFLSRFPYKQCVLPRQARDKRKETLQKEAFFTGVYTKTAMFTKGFTGPESARFRMWESHSCQDLQPPHIHFYRAQALQTLFPTLERQIPVFYNHSQVRPQLLLFQDLY